MAEYIDSSDSDASQFGEALLRVLNEISDRAGNHKCAFRGQTDAKWVLASGADRRIKKSVDDVEEIEDVEEDESAEEEITDGAGVKLSESTLREYLLAYHKILLRDAHQKGFGIDEGRELSDLELLAQLQHFKAATMMLDFTYSPLVALYFACEDEEKKEDKDGKIFIVHIGEYTVAPNDSKIEKLIKDKEIYQWTPILHGAAERRMSAQSGLFLVNLPEKDDRTIFEVTISKDDKHKILDALNRFCKINQDTLFNDLAGFAENRSHRSNLDKSEALMHRAISIMEEGRDEKE